MKILTAIMGAERRLNTVSGNPRWKITTRTGAWNTKADAQIGHTDFETLATNKAQVELEIDGQGAIVGCVVI